MNIEQSLLPTNLESLIRPVPKTDGAVYQIPVAAGNVLRQLACGVFQAIDQMAFKSLPIAESDVVDAFEYLLAARCAYVSGICKLDQHPKDIEYPSLLFPILAAIGRYVDNDLNLTLLPIPEMGYQGILSADADGKVTANASKRVTKGEKFNLVMSTLRAFGVNTSIGLPMDKDIESDDLFRLDEVEGALVGGKKEPSSHNLYARAMLEMQYLATLFGEARVTYLALSTLRAGIYDLISRHVRGPSRRSS